MTDNDARTSLCVGDDHVHAVRIVEASKRNVGRPVSNMKTWMLAVFDSITNLEELKEARCTICALGYMLSELGHW